MPVTTILQHATGREIPVKTETDSDTHMSKDEDNLICGHMPVQAGLDTTESCSPKDSQASNAKKPAPATSPSSSHQPKQPRKTSASRRRRKSRSSSTQIASETGQYTFVAENLPSAEPIPLGASSSTPFGMSNGTTTYEQSPKGTWEPQLTYCHTPPASSIDYTNEEAVPNASVAAEDVLNPDNIQSTTASPSTNQSSGQRSSFASSSGQTSPSSYFTAHSSPKGYKPAQASLEINNTSRAGNEPVADTSPQTTSSLQHIHQQAVTSSREEEEVLHHVAASRLAESPQPARIDQPVPTIEQVPPAQAEVAAQERVKVNSKQPPSSQPRQTLRSSSVPFAVLNPLSASPEAITETSSKTLLSSDPQLVSTAQPEMITRSKSRSSQAAAARHRAKNQRRQRAASQSAASPQPTENSSSSRRATTRQPTATTRSLVAASSLAVVSAELAAQFQAVTPSNDVSSQEDNSHGTAALQQVRQRMIAPQPTEATHHLLASQSVATPYSAANSQHVYPQSVYSNSLSSQYHYQQNGYSPAPAAAQSEYAQPSHAQHHPDCPNNPYTRQSAATQMSMDQAEFLRNGTGPSQVGINFVPYAQGGTGMLDMQSGERNTMMEYLMPQDPESLAGTRVSNCTPEIYASILQQQAQRMQAAYPYGSPQYTMMSPSYAHPDTVPPEAHYNTLYAAPMQYGDMQTVSNLFNGALGLQQPQNMATPDYMSHPNALASHNGVQPQSFPTVHSQRPNNEPYMSYAYQASIQGPQLQNSFDHGAQGTSWQDGQAIRRDSLGDASDIQEVSREAWQAANRVNMGRRAMSRARSTAPSLQRNASLRPGGFMPTTNQRTSRVHAQTSGYRASLPRAQHPIFERRVSANSQAPATPREAPPGDPTQVAPQISPTSGIVSTATTAATLGTAATSKTTTTLRALAAARTPLPNAPRGRRSGRPRNSPRYGGIQRQTPPREKTPPPAPRPVLSIRSQGLPSRLEGPLVQPEAEAEGPSVQTQEPRAPNPDQFLQTQSNSTQARARAQAPEASIQSQAPSTIQSQESPAQIQEPSAQVQAQEQSIRAQEQGTQTQAPQSSVETYRLPLPTPESLRQPRQPRIPVLEPRIEILIPIFISGATLVPRPYRARGACYQIQPPVLVEHREPRSTEKGPANEME